MSPGSCEEVGHLILTSTVLIQEVGGEFTHIMLVGKPSLEVMSSLPPDSVNDCDLPFS